MANPLTNRGVFHSLGGTSAFRILRVTQICTVAVLFFDGTPDFCTDDVVRYAGFGERIATS
jgi:hypothetical protein